MSVELTARTAAGAALVALAERLAIARLLADPPPGAARDRVAPSVSGLTASAQRVRFTLSEPADVRVVVERKRRGRRARVVRKRLLAARPAGANTARLRIRARGRYRVTVTATDRAGNRSRPRARCA